MYNGSGLPTTGAGLPTTGAGLPTTGAGLPTTGASLPGAGLQTTTTTSTAAVATAITTTTATGTAADTATDTATDTGSTSSHTTKLGKKPCSANHKYVKHINRLDKVKDKIDILARKRNKLRVTQSKHYSIRRILAGQALGQWTVLDTPNKTQDEKNLAGLLKFRTEEKTLLEKIKEDEKMLEATKVEPTIQLRGPIPGNVRMAEW